LYFEKEIGYPYPIYLRLALMIRDGLFRRMTEQAQEFLKPDHLEIESAGANSHQRNFNNA
jgi:hypothetical protein